MDMAIYCDEIWITNYAGSQAWDGLFTSSSNSA